MRYLTVDEKFIEIRDIFKFIEKENSVIERIITELDASVMDDRHVSLKKGNETVGIIEALSKGKIKIKDDSYSIHRSSESSHESAV